MKPNRAEAYRLLHEGSIALAHVEANGMRIDTAKLEAMIKSATKTVERKRAQLKEDDVYKLWKRKYKHKTKLGNKQQLADILFNEMGFKSHVKTEKGENPSGNEENLRQVDHPFVKLYIDTDKIRNIRDTFLKGIQRETYNGFLHPLFDLNHARTYRSSSSKINFQQIPTRTEMGRKVRKVFVPRDNDHVLVEVDYGSLEVRIAACYNKDPVLIDYIQHGDMHKDLAAKCYKVNPDQVNKDMRYMGKNGFVFPEFYGSFYKQCAPALWAAIDQYQFEVNGIPIREHLKKKGIKKLGECDFNEQPKRGTFEAHIKSVEDEFWSTFSVFDKWRHEWVKKYIKRGWFEMLSGFVCQGAYGRNKIFNYSIQGAAFHCLLWSLIELVKEMTKRKMKSKIIGQIHDSIVADVLKRELDDYLALIKRIMTEDIRKAWDWIIIPLIIEAEVAKDSWYNKEKIEI